MDEGLKGWGTGLDGGDEGLKGWGQVWMEGMGVKGVGVGQVWMEGVRVKGVGGRG